MAKFSAGMFVRFYGTGNAVRNRAKCAMCAQPPARPGKPWVIGTEWEESVDKSRFSHGLMVPTPFSPLWPGCVSLPSFNRTILMPPLRRGKTMISPKTQIAFNRANGSKNE